jgi:dimethylaniline monooxygenase (N-oxide forming)
MKTVCVVGGGIAGLAVTKELCAQGLEVDCYEMMPRVGGVFASHVWRGGHLTSSSVFTWFSDFPVADRQTFFSWEQLLEYLERYVDHFGIRERIQLDTRVEEVRRVGQRWRVRVHRANWSNGHPFHPPDHRVEDSTFEREYDHLVICSGLHHAPSIPAIPGLEGFAGCVLHSSEYREAEQLRGRRVIVVGSGESASDIALQVAEVAAHCTISMRSAPGTLFPRWIQGNTPDIRDDRLTYGLPRILAPLVLKRHRAFYHAQKQRPELFRWAADSNFGNNRCPFNTNACKSFGIPEAVIDHGATLRGPIARVEGERVVFADGSDAQADAIVFCTGFRRAFPFLAPELSDKLVGLDSLWKNVVHPDLGDTLFMVGFARPHQINLVSVAEMQARLVGQVLCGRGLPAVAAMRETIAADHAWMRRYFGDRYDKNPALVDYLYYTDGLAKFIGCEVPLRRAALRDPALFLKLVFASMNGAHFRLVGPGADWDAAAAVIKATPTFSNKRDAVQRWILGSALTLYASVRGRFQPEWRLVSDQARP